MLGLRTIEVVSPVGGTDVAFERMSGDEVLGRPFEYTVDLLSTRGDLTIEDALGKPLTVVVETEAEPRNFNGIVARFAQVGWTGRHFRYRALLRPWLWLLSRSSNSRIFQNKTIPDILAAVFDAHGFSGDVDDGRLDRDNYKPVEYLVQYNETDFNFVSRLMEQAGITYHFTHTAGRHTLVMSNGLLTEKIPGLGTIPYFSGDSGTDALGHTHISDWSIGVQVSSAAYAAKEFDFQNPKAPLLSVLSSPKPGGDSKLELFEYPGQYIDDNLRQAYVTRRLEEAQEDHTLSQGTSNARALRPGLCFSLADHPWDALNKEYLVTAASYSLVSNAQVTGEAEAEEDFVCHFSAVDSKTIYRTPALTPKSRVQGPQTATVVGDKGQEIWTDKFGRVKVQFHWDREGQNDEKSSCWVRVSQIWAGTKWGGIHIPRIGQEVIVDFLEGDPDRPIITGRVYNNDNMPPYDLPANATQSGIKSRSSMKGAPNNFNELRFEDKKGSEQVYVQAEKDLQTLVKNDESREVDHDRTTEIKNDETVTVGGNRTETVQKNESITINGARTENVAKDESISIGGSRSETVAKSESVSIGGARSLSVAKDDSTSVDGAQTLEVAKDQTITVSGGRAGSISKDDSLTIDGKLSIQVAKDGAIQIGKKLVIDVSDEITIQTGDATISMKKNGDITIKGKNVTVDASGKANIKAGGDVILKGSKVTQN
jgi:type VI secretion system secreted protein VgrG